MNPNNVNKASNGALSGVIQKVESHYGGEIALAVKSGLAVIAAHSLTQREKLPLLALRRSLGKGQIGCGQYTNAGPTGDKGFLASR